MSEKRKRGRPRKFKSPEAMQKLIDAYFDECDNRIIPMQVEDKVNGGIIEMAVNKPAPYTITGLALALDTDRQTLLNYQQEYEPGYFDTIKKAKLRVQQYAENHLYEGKNPTGAIFNLKCNYAWQDKQVIEQTGTMNISFGGEAEKGVDD